MVVWTDVLEYKEGTLYWKVKPANNVKAGAEAGTVERYGYKTVGYKGKTYYMHRIIYQMHYGEIPEGMQVDHINRIKDDNRIENLRLVTQQQNQWNNNAKGYSLHKATGKWRAYIKINNKQKYLGLYDTEEEAREAYLTAKKEVHTIGEGNA